MAETGTIRQLVFFHGQVQGVGFRMTARRIASDFAVTGFVRNLPNGRVELVAEGCRDEVQRFVDRLRESMAGHVRHCDCHQLGATGEFDRFTIES
jgi:acylphosphatase